MASRRQRPFPALPGATGWFQLAIEGAPAAMVAVDREGRIAFVNVQAERLFGYRRDELVGKPVELLVPTTSRAAHRDARRAYLADPTARPMGAGRDLFALRKDGVEVPVEVGLSPRTTPEGVFVLSAVIDISARKRAEQLLREADHRKDEFLAMIAHELRNPLAALANALHLLRLGIHADDARALAERQVTRLTRIVDQLLDVGRMAQGKVTLQTEVLEIGEVVQGAVEAARHAQATRRQRTRVELPPEPIHILGDRMRLEQVFGNLLDNASKYSHDGGEITVEVTRAEDLAEIRVRDVGIGIAPEDRLRMFDLFAQGNRSPASTAPGLGIGLTVVRRLVEQHGGSVDVESAGLGQGSEFVVRLPRVEPPAPAVLAPPPVRDPAVERLRLLLVDDNRDILETLGPLLRARGHEVRTVVDGPAALELVSTFVPDAVLLDIGLPGMDGYEVARRLRHQTRGLTLVALTGYGSEQDRQRARDAGIDGHLTKPVDLDALEGVLQSLRSSPP